MPILLVINNKYLLRFVDLIRVYGFKTIVANFPIIFPVFFAIQNGNQQGKQCTGDYFESNIFKYWCIALFYNNSLKVLLECTEWCFYPLPITVERKNLLSLENGIFSFSRASVQRILARHSFGSSVMNVLFFPLLMLISPNPNAAKRQILWEPDFPLSFLCLSLC